MFPKVFLVVNNVHILLKLFGVLVLYLMGFHLLPSATCPLLASPPPYFPHLLLFLLLPSSLLALFSFPPESSCKMPSKEADSVMLAVCHGNTQTSRP